MPEGGNDRAETGNRGRQGRRLSYPRRLSLDLTEDDYHALQGARYADRVPMADRVRALLSLWREDPALAAAVSTRAQELLLASMSPPDQAEPAAQADPPHPKVSADPGVPPAS